VLAQVQKRGQARLPEPMISQSMIAARMAFNIKAIAQIPESQGRERGHGPALIRGDDLNA
jgi:hypothetical protein